MSATGNNGAPPRGPMQAAQKPELPKRFYQLASVVAEAGGAASVRLDGRMLKTPGGRPALLPPPIAERVAAEWAAQGERIDPVSMPLTRLVNTALDGVVGREREVVDDIVKYAASDLVCYRAIEPPSLVAAQAAAWDPVVAYARDVLGAPLRLASGIVFVAQPEQSLDNLRVAAGGHQGLALAALHVVTTLTGSAVLALALAAGAFTPTEVWDAAHVDEDWQIARWGTDREATARRAARRVDFDAAATVIALAARR
jgi:chaperone required for assembly of F1-ATPase